MPKPTKLHAKKKPNSIQKSVNADSENSAGADPEEAFRQFQLELCWCIQQLEKTLQENKGNEKQLTEAWKVLAVLKNNSQPVIRKRQLMRTHFGDYRAKMAAEEKKLSKLTSKIKISDTPTQPKATFLRKSAFLTTGDSSFRFNFALAPEQVDTVNTKVNTGNTEVDTGNTKVDTGNTEMDTGNTEVDTGNTEVDTGNTEDDGNSTVDNVTIDNKTKNVDNTSDIKDSTQENKKFKFTFSDSEFKFNFNVNNF